MKLYESHVIISVATTAQSHFSSGKTWQWDLTSTITMTWQSIFNFWTNLLESEHSLVKAQYKVAKVLVQD
jgi:hypothetical protein